MLDDERRALPEDVLVVLVGVDAELLPVPVLGALLVDVEDREVELPELDGGARLRVHEAELEVRGRGVPHVDLPE